MTQAISYLRRGLTFYRAGASRAALALFVQAVLSDPDDWRAWLYLALASEDSAQRTHAWRQVLRLDPANPSARSALGIAPGSPLEVPDPSPHYRPPAEPGAGILLLGSGLVSGLGDLLFLTLLIVAWLSASSAPAALLVNRLGQAITGAAASALLLPAAAFSGLWLSWPLARQVGDGALTAEDYGKACARPVLRALGVVALGCLVLGGGALLLSAQAAPALILSAFVLRLAVVLPAWAWTNRALAEGRAPCRVVSLAGLVAVAVTRGLWLITLFLLP